MGNIFVGIVTGAMGLAYIVYGRRRTKLVPVLAGVLLCIFPYLVESWIWLGVICAILLAAPFVIDF